MTRDLLYKSVFSMAIFAGVDADKLSVVDLASIIVSCIICMFIYLLLHAQTHICIIYQTYVLYICYVNDLSYSLMNVEVYCTCRFLLKKTASGMNLPVSLLNYLLVLLWSVFYLFLAAF